MLQKRVGEINQSDLYTDATKLINDKSKLDVGLIFQDMFQKNNKINFYNYNYRDFINIWDTIIITYNEEKKMKFSI